MPSAQLVLVRHGQSVWNRQNRFTGWQNPPLSSQGRAEARQTGKLLASRQITFDTAYTSYLQRAAETLWLIQKTMQLMWLPVTPDWRLNERHYGKLQGQNKTVAEQQHGAAQVHEWRRGYTQRPPAGESADAPDHRYYGVPTPHGESLADTQARVLSCYRERLLPLLQAQQRVLVVAHGNSLRALVMHLDNLADTAGMQLEIPTGAALVYDCADNQPAPPHRIIV